MRGQGTAVLVLFLLALLCIIGYAVAQAGA
jgi:hypothetical protein